MLLVYLDLRFHCIWLPQKSKFSEVRLITLDWMITPFFIHKHFFFDLSYFMSLNLCFEQYCIIAIRAYVLLLYFLNFLCIHYENSNFWLFLTFSFLFPSISCNVVLQIQFNVNQLLLLHCFTSSLSRKKPDTEFRVARNCSSPVWWYKTRAGGGKQQSNIW